MRSLLASKSRRGIGGDNGMGGGGIPALPALSDQTLAALYDGSLPAGQTYARLSNAWNSESGAVGPHNLLLQSNAFTTTWAPAGTPSAAQNAVDPWGNANTAWTLTDNAAGVSEGITAAAGTLTAVNHVLSVYVAKTVGAQSAYPIIDAYTTAGGTQAATATIDTTNGVVTVWTARSGVIVPTSSAQIVSSSATHWRVSLTFLATAAAWVVEIYPAGTTNSTQSTGTFDTSAQGSAVFYGAQLNAYALTDYVPTTTAAVYAPRYLQGKQGQGILVESASTNKCTAYSVPRSDSLGAELLTTAEAACDSGWTLSGATGNDGTITFTNTAQSALIVGKTVVGKQYILSFTVSGSPTGTVRSAGNTWVITPVTGANSISYLASSTSAGLLTTSTSAITITDISIKEVTDSTAIISRHNGTDFTQNIPSMTLSGDTAAVLSIVNDQAAIDSAIALNPTDGSMVALQAAKANGYKVYKLDNSLGVVTATVRIDAATGNTNIHAWWAITRKISGANTSYVGMSLSPYTSAQITTTDYAKTVSIGAPSASAKIDVQAAVGTSIIFLAPQLEESPYATSPILCNGVATTRASSTPSSPTAGVVGGTGMEKSGSLTTGTGFAVTGNDATHTITFGASGARYLSDTTTPTLALVSSNILTVGKTYRVQINTTVTSGNIKIDGFSGVSISPAAGLNIYDVIATSAGVTTYRTAANTDVLITEFSIKEVNILPATIQGWWKPEGVAAGKVQTLWSTYTGAADYTRIVYSGTQLIFTKAKTAQTTETITYTVTLTANTWNHFAITLAADGTALMYLNGVAVGTNGTTTAFAPVIAATMQPGAFNSTLQADSVLENYRYFDRVLTATEIVTYVARGK